jgi:hypothetical protein
MNTLVLTMHTLYTTFAEDTEAAMTRTLSIRIPQELARRVAERTERWVAANDSENWRAASPSGRSAGWPPTIARSIAA